MKFIGNFVSKFAHFHYVFLHELLVFDYHNLSTTTMEGDRQPMLEGKFIMYIPVVCIYPDCILQCVQLTHLVNQ